MKKHKEMIFGIHAITQAMQTGNHNLAKIWIKRNVRSTALQALLMIATKHNVPCSKVPVEKLNRMTNGNHQGAIALIAPIPFIPLATVINNTYEQGKSPCLVVLDHIQDMHNFGAIVRSAVGAGIHAAVIHTQASLPITGDALKASAGALLQLPICRTHNLIHTFSELRHSGLQLVACTPNAQKTIYDLDMTLPTAVLLGGEHKGIATKHLAKCDLDVRIPMNGNIDSLNVSVAASIIFYERVRQMTKANSY